MPIFPMREVNKEKYKNSLNKKINITLSNIDMKIVLSKKKYLSNFKNKIILNSSNLKSEILPSFTKKIFNSISNQ